MVSFTVGCNTIVFSAFDFQNVKDTIVSFNVANTNLMKPWRSQNYEQQHILNNLWFHQVCIYESGELCALLFFENKMFENTMASINVFNTNLMKPWRFNVSENKMFKKTNGSWLGRVSGKRAPTSTKAHPNPYQSIS